MPILRYSKKNILSRSSNTFNEPLQSITLYSKNGKFYLCLHIFQRYTKESYTRKSRIHCSIHFYIFDTTHKFYWYDFWICVLQNENNQSKQQKSGKWVLINCVVVFTLLERTSTSLVFTWILMDCDFGVSHCIVIMSYVTIGKKVLIDNIRKYLVPHI